jgi:nicotinamidase-related amidase
MPIQATEKLSGDKMPALHGLDKGQHPALLISECQRSMTDPNASAVAALNQQVHERGILPKIAALAQVCREAGVPVVHCTIVALPGFKGFAVNCRLSRLIVQSGELVAGHPKAEIAAELTPQPGDIVSQRCHGMTAFHGTELESILRGLGIETVILAGVSSNIALPGMCTEAVNRGFNVVIAEDCTAGGSAESHAFQVKNHLPFLATVSNSAAIRQALGHQRLSQQS